MLDYEGSKPASDLHVKVYPENAHDKSIKVNIDGGDDAPYKIEQVKETGEYKLCAKSGKSGTAKLTLYAGDVNASSECYVTVLKETENYDDYLDFAIEDNKCTVKLKNDISKAPTNLVIPSTYTFSNGKTMNVTVMKMNAMHIYPAPKFTTVTLPPSLKTIEGNSFNNWSNLKAVNYNGTSSVTEIGICAFYGCSSLEWFKISNKLTSSTSIGNQAFSKCEKLKFFLDGESDVFSVSDDKTMLFDKNKTKLIASPPSIKGDADGHLDLSIYPNLTTLCKNTFEENKYLRKVTFPSKVKIIPECAFQFCTGFKEAIFPADSQLETIELKAFYQCNALKNIVFPASLKNIGVEAFHVADPDNAGLTSAEFLNKQSKWTIDTSPNPITDYDVSNASTNATNLKNAYKERNWTRNK